MDSFLWIQTGWALLDAAVTTGSECMNAWHCRTSIWVWSLRYYIHLDSYHGHGLRLLLPLL